MKKLMLIFIMSCTAMEKDKEPESHVIELQQIKVEADKQNENANKSLQNEDLLLQAYFGQDHNVGFLRPFVSKRIAHHEKKNGESIKLNPQVNNQLGQQIIELNAPLEQLVADSIVDCHNRQECYKKIFLALAGLLGTAATAFFTVFLNCQQSK